MAHVAWYLEAQPVGVLLAMADRYVAMAHLCSRPMAGSQSDRDEVIDHTDGNIVRPAALHCHTGHILARASM